MVKVKIAIKKQVKVIKSGIIQERNCENPRATTFVDDNMIVGRREGREDIKKTVERIIKNTAQYINYNLLSQNNDKTQVMIISNEEEMTNKFSIEKGDKKIQHSKSVYALG